MKLKVIAYAHNGHTDKFGIPRQSREESPILTRIVFEPEYAVREALRGLEGYSHLWILWGFSEVPEGEWSPTVRPPRLGGNKRMGVFATRSPYRPNPIGLSSVKLVKIVNSRKSKVDSGSLELIVSGADVLDGTPIYDIKPYLSFSDSHPEAKNGFAEETKDYKLEVEWQLSECDHSREWLENGSIKEPISYILSQDPRPAYQDDSKREYKLDYAGYTVTFVVEASKVIVKKIEKK